MTRKALSVFSGINMAEDPGTLPCVRVQVRLTV